MGVWISLLFTPPSRIIHLNNKKLLIKKRLGEGGFSYVYLVQDVYSRQILALKKMLCQTDELLQTGQHEAEMLKKFNHPNILRLVDSATVPSTRVRGAKEVLMLIPFMQRGTLQDVLDCHRVEHGITCNTSPYTEREVLTLFRGICEGVKQFHTEDPPLALRDLKPGNVLLSDKSVPVLMDFGSVGPARVTISDRRSALALQESADLMSTPNYRAPELFNIPSECTLDERADIWSLGCILYALIYSHGPFDGNASVALAVQSNVPYPEAPFSPQLIALARSMLTLDYRERPFISDVIFSIDNILKSIETTISISQ